MNVVTRGGISLLSVDEAEREFASGVDQSIEMVCTRGENGRVLYG